MTVNFGFRITSIIKYDKHIYMFRDHIYSIMYIYLDYIYIYILYISLLILYLIIFILALVLALFYKFQSSCGCNCKILSYRVNFCQF